MVAVVALLAICLQRSDNCNSDFDNKILKDSLDMNTKLLDSFRFKLSAFNSEYNSLTGVCTTSIGESIIFDNENEMDDQETVWYGFYKLGTLSCAELLNLLRHHDLDSYKKIFNEAVALNQNISTSKEKEANCWLGLSNWGYTILVILSLIIIFLYVRLMIKIKKNL